MVRSSRASGLRMELSYHIPILLLRASRGARRFKSTKNPAELVGSRSGF